jgi:ABC-type Fe3+-siderophore transport system permease subunit
VRRRDSPDRKEALMLERHRTLREGVISGFLGATAVAVWFLVLDTASGRPLATPTMLGQSVASFFGEGEGASALTYVLGYTMYHYAAFALVGIVISAIVNNAEREPSMLIGLMFLFVAFEVGWYGFTALLSRSEYFGALAWYQVMVANLVAALTIGLYMWRSHPALLGRFAHELAGGER